MYPSTVNLKHLSKETQKKIKDSMERSHLLIHGPLKVQSTMLVFQLVRAHEHTLQTLT